MGGELELRADPKTCLIKMNKCLKDKVLKKGIKYIVFCAKAQSSLTVS